MNTTPIIENRFWQPEFECMPRPQLRELQARRLREVVARAATVPFYKCSSTASDSPPNRSAARTTCAACPSRTSPILHNNYPLGLVAVPRSEIARFQGTSGTTGKPTWTAYTKGRRRPLGRPLRALPGQRRPAPRTHGPDLLRLRPLHRRLRPAQRHPARRRGDPAGLQRNLCAS